MSALNKSKEAIFKKNDCSISSNIPTIFSIFRSNPPAAIPEEPQAPGVSNSGASPIEEGEAQTTSEAVII